MNLNGLFWGVVLGILVGGYYSLRVIIVWCCHIWVVDFLNQGYNDQRGLQNKKHCTQ